MAELRLEKIRKSFGGLEVVHGIDLIVEDGSFTVLVGPSGCGKSTLLRMIAGLESVSDGEIHLGGRRCDHLLPSARGMAMVFQSYALYPHMTVYDNLKFGLVCQKVPKAEIGSKIRKAAEMLQIEHLLKRRPSELSGGQSQRVAIGRAIVLEPEIFLFDEPLSNLDAELRVKMRIEIAELHRRLGNTMVYVTHDQVEAMTMADRIAVLRDGRLEQFGDPLELYARPANRFVAGFLGTPHMNLIDVRVSGTSEAETAVSVAGNEEIKLPVRPGAVQPGDEATLGIRPEHLEMRTDGPLRGRVSATEILGGETVVHAILDGHGPVVAKQAGIVQLAPGSTIQFGFDPEFGHIFAGAEGEALEHAKGWEAVYVQKH